MDLARFQPNVSWSVCFSIACCSVEKLLLATSAAWPPQVDLETEARGPDPDCFLGKWKIRRLFFSEYSIAYLEISFHVLPDKGHMGCNMPWSNNRHTMGSLPDYISLAVFVVQNNVAANKDSTESITSMHSTSKSNFSHQSSPHCFRINTVCTNNHSSMCRNHQSNHTNPLR